MLQPGAGKAVWILMRRLGITQASRVIWQLVRGEQRGEPFAHLPPPDSEEERLSRAQIGPGILLYKILKQRMSQDDATALTEEAIVAGAIAFLRRSIGPLRSSDLEAMDQTQRKAFVEERGKRFFNATMRWDTIEPKEVVFTVLSCRFPRLCREAGVPELAPSFCKGDATFFGTVEPNVRLERPHTIATGADTCHFSLQWVDDPTQPEAKKH